MEWRISFKHMKSSQAVAECAQAKILHKIEKYATKAIEAHVTFSVDGRSHHVHCTVNAGDGLHCEADGVSEDMYGSVDLLLDKLEVQLKKQKEKLKDHKHSLHLGVLATEQQEPAIEDADAMDAADVIKFEKARKKLVSM